MGDPDIELVFTAARQGYGFSDIVSLWCLVQREERSGGSTWAFGRVLDARLLDSIFWGGTVGFRFSIHMPIVVAEVSALHGDWRFFPS